MANPTAVANDEVFDILRDAAALYERYVDLARLGAATALNDAAHEGSVEVDCTQPDLSHPLGVVIDTGSV